MSKRIRPQVSRVLRGIPFPKKNRAEHVTRQSKLRRRVSRGAALGLALFTVGAGYALLAPTGAAQEGPGQNESMQVRIGKQLYDNSCITCHGANLQGVQDRGPSLIGVGGAAVYFQVVSGRMPAEFQGAQVERVEKPKFGAEEGDALAAYIQSVAGGPRVPEDLSLKDANIAEGGELFRLNCASCHNFAGKGGALSGGKHAPKITANTKEIYAAMLNGPQNMPPFPDNQLTQEQKQNIIAYINTLRKTNDPGGSGLGGYGPVPEGIVAWVVGIGGLLLTTVWIGSKS